MMSTKLGSPDGGKKTKVALFGSAEGLSGLASCPTIIDASIYCSIVLLVLVSLETALALWVELTPIFRYQCAKFMSGTFLPPKRLEGTLVERFRFNISTFWVPRSIHESKQKQKEKLPFGLGEPAIADAQVLTSCLKVPSPPI
jgi:hypothetical protein